MPNILEIKLVNLHIATSLIKGNTTKSGIPVSCEIRAYNRITGVLLSKSRSDTNGKYILFGSHNQPNYVIAIDPEEEFNIAAQDNVK